MENQNIKKEVQNDPIQNVELNNNIILDIIIKSSKLQQAANILLDYNNNVALDVVISPEEFQRLSALALEQITLLKALVERFADDYSKKIQGGSNENLKSNESADNADLQESQIN